MSNRAEVVVTIDGPAASGKTSVSRGIAKKFGWEWLSSGAFYRGLAYIAVVSETNPDDEKALVDLCLGESWQVKMSPEATLVLHNNQDVTDKIYREDVANMASKISHYPGVRSALLQGQRDCVLGVEGLVCEGRDCGTVVFPEAQVKIYLTADSQDRAQRRAAEEGKSVEETAQQQSQRDKQDSSRKASPMMAAKDAHIVDTTGMGLEQVIGHIGKIVAREIGL